MKKSNRPPKSAADTGDPGFMLGGAVCGLSVLMGAWSFISACIDGLNGHPRENEAGLAFVAFGVFIGSALIAAGLNRPSRPINLEVVIGYCFGALVLTLGSLAASTFLLPWPTGPIVEVAILGLGVAGLIIVVCWSGKQEQRYANDPPELAKYRPAGRIITSIGAAIFAGGVAGLFIGPAGYTVARQVVASMKYIETSGVILESAVKAHGDGDSTTYSSSVRYSYNVEGETYIGDRYSYTTYGSSNIPSLGQGMSQGHGGGQAVTVFYDPQAPSQSVLTRRVDGMGTLILCVFQPFFAMWLGLVWVGVTAGSRYRRAVTLLRDGLADASQLPGGLVVSREGEVLTLTDNSRLGPSLRYLVICYGYFTFATVPAGVVLALAGLTHLLPPLTCLAILLAIVMSMRRFYRLRKPYRLEIDIPHGRVVLSAHGNERALRRAGIAKVEAMGVKDYEALTLGSAAWMAWSVSLRGNPTIEIRRFFPTIMNDNLHEIEAKALRDQLAKLLGLSPIPARRRAHARA